jgi:dTMP kinase
MTVARGRFITFEGGEGCGKTTQIKLLSETLTQRGIAHITTREPGGTPLAEKIRPLLVEAQMQVEDWNPLAETLLFLAARAQHWQQKIEPALESGQWVLCDRFMDSTFVYQGIGKGLGLAFLQQLQHSLGGGAWKPDLTLLLDIDPTQGLERAHKRHHNETRFEDLDTHFHQRLREGFLQIATAEPQRVKVINAALSLSEVQARINDACFW